MTLLATTTTTLTEEIVAFGAAPLTALLGAASTLAFPSFSFVGNWENGRGRKSEEGRGAEKRWGSSNLIDPRNQITAELIILFPSPFSQIV